MPNVLQFQLIDTHFKSFQSWHCTIIEQFLFFWVRHFIKGVTIMNDFFSKLKAIDLYIYDRKLNFWRFSEFIIFFYLFWTKSEKIAHLQQVLAGKCYSLEIFFLSFIWIYKLFSRIKLPISLNSIIHLFSVEFAMLCSCFQ